uniref:LamG-like jellyroll fold domain-containing protein n=1 Tax=viral metagenome TaxID=1070528 RepID=A0A6C0KP25_9ZZZZ
MSIFPLLLLISIILLGIVVSSELIAPGLVQEGFENLPESSYWARFVAPRNDIGSFKEDQSYIRDPRYYSDYADVGRLGVPYDFCRMIAPADDPTNLFFACALAGTDGLDSAKFRTAGTKDGFRISYDDYMRDVNGDGRADYCRILANPDSSWQPMCVKSTDTGFDSKEVVDSDPPAQIQTLLTFYQGCVVWLRFMSDMKDTIGNINVQTAGSIVIDETPRRDTTDGLYFNGSNQFLRISDQPDLSLGFHVPLRAVRVFMLWAKFDKFTNNAKLFDFGNGKAMDNVFLGILGKGDPPASASASASLRQRICGDESTVPTGNSGAQFVAEMTPQVLMETSAANVNEFVCLNPELRPRKLSPSFPPTGDINTDGATRATLIYEIWDKQARKMRIKVNGAVPLGEWVHIAIAATNEDAFRPNLGVYINGQKIVDKESGFLPSTGTMTNCYLGKSNWANATSQYENRDELFQGSMFDFRMYQGRVPEQMIKDSYSWGKMRLNM